MFAQCRLGIGKNWMIVHPVLAGQWVRWGQQLLMLRQLDLSAQNPRLGQLALMRLWDRQRPVILVGLAVRLGRCRPAFRGFPWGQLVPTRQCCLVRQ